jgi:hypothetical protein
VPILQLFLAGDGFSRRCERLDVDEAVHTVFLDEFRTTAVPMLLSLVRRSLVTRNMRACSADGRGMTLQER